MATQPPSIDRKPYIPPTLVVYGDFAALTLSVKNSRDLDSHPGQGMTRS